MEDTDFPEVLVVQEVPISSKSFTFAAENFLPVSKSFSPREDSHKPVIKCTLLPGHD